MAKTDEAKSVQEFFYSAPEANSVQLVGDFTHWQSKPVNLVKQANGVWKTGSSEMFVPGMTFPRYMSHLGRGCRRTYAGAKDQSGSHPPALGMARPGAALLLER